jgi:hypothetical protein
MKEFDILHKAISLSKRGRLNAAREFYSLLDKDFQRKLLELSIFRYNHRVPKRIKFESRYGEFTLSEGWLDDIEALIEACHEAD